jgi:hypothetical protein
MKEHMIVVVRRKDLIPYQEWHEIFNWAENHGLDWKSRSTFNFLNHWTDNSGECYSFKIHDEKIRMMFILRWS